MGTIKVLIPILVICSLHLSNADTCSWQNCNKWSKSKETINVHLICHTHDDLGWIKNVDEYYYGAKQKLVPVGVQYIVNNVVTELQKDLSRRFSWAETGFLWRWINTHHDFQRHNLVKLVQRGQLEIIGGGWVQNDEATTHYIDIVDQMTFGLRKLNQTFGRCGIPRVAWQIDPFGHSREMANLFAMMDYEALFFARMHYLEKANRLKNNSLEFIWNVSDDLKNDILTGAFYADNYGPPPGFCYDTFCDDEPIIDDQVYTELNNVDERVNAFLAYVKKQASHQRTNHLMLLMGSDFQYSNANQWFTNLDKLIQYVNEKENETKVRVFYSTPSCYMDAVNEAQPRLPQKSDDFFPYASSNHSFWTGYFTSRPAFKGFVRGTSSLLQLTKQLDAIACLGPEDASDLDVLRMANSLVQHHDAVTGTAREAVNRDYARRLAFGWDEGEQVINDAMSKLAVKDKSKQLLKQTVCRLTNETICEATKSLGSQFTVTVFNSNSHPLSTVVRIPFYGTNVSVTGPKGESVDVQVIKTFRGTSQLKSTETAPYELLLPAEIPAFGFATYFVVGKSNSRRLLSRKQYFLKGKQINRGVRTINNQQQQHQPEKSVDELKTTVNISNGIIEVSFDENGYISSVQNLQTNKTTKLRQEFLYYDGFGFPQGDNQSSGAYIFRPNGTIAHQLSPNITLTVVLGALSSEVHQTVNEWTTQIIRLIKDKNFIEFEWTIGPIPKETGNPITKEVITRYTTDIASNGEFFTDANGRQMMLRKRNYSACYEYEDTEPVAGNYYPVNSRIFIRDSNTQLTVLTDRSQGGSSLQDGQIELMLHRRTFYDDHCGVDEALDEPGVTGDGLVVRGRHWILLDTPDHSSKMHRPLAFELYHSPVLSFAPLNMPIEQYRASYNTLYSGLTRSLPDHLNIATLEQWTGKSLLLRLEHIYQNNEDTTLSQPVTVDVEWLFTSFKIVSLEELNLAASQRKHSQYKRADYWWNRSNRFTNRFLNDFTIELKPMEIRTFKAEVQMQTC